MFQNHQKLRRHAEQIVGVKHGESHPDIPMWMSRLRKAIQKGKLKARRHGDTGDYEATRKEVERWYRQQFRECGIAFLTMLLLLSPMLLPGGGL